MTSLSDIFGDDATYDTIERPVIETATTDSSNPAADLVQDLIYWLENVKTSPPREPGLHCSSLWKTCARRALLEFQYASELQTEVIAAGNRMTFDMGHALHNMIQNEYLGPLKRIYGDWKCLVCQEIIHTGLMPDRCHKCCTGWRDEVDGSLNIIYSELFVYDEELDFRGHCDGVLVGRGPNPKNRVFEFKTKSKSQFEKLTSPDWAHTIQVHAYMHCLKMDEAIILYWDKGSQCDWSRDLGGRWIAGAPHLKSYLVKFNPHLWEVIAQRIRDYHRAVELIRSLPVINGSVVKTFPRACDSRSCELALDCPVSSQCFSMV